MSEFNPRFLDRMSTLLGAEYGDFLSALEKPAEKAIFVNTNKITVEKFKSIVDFSLQTIKYEKSGFYIDGEKLGRHPLHHAGAFYIQEPSAMFTVNAYSFKGDEYVLDMCAAPGGKSIQIANRIPNGLLVSNEYISKRADILYSNIERMGLKNVIITNDSPENIATAYANTFDVCLVDAPCSGEGMFRRGEDIVNEWTENAPAQCRIRQLDILDKADKALKTGGHLIYSTCTYSLEENESVVKEFIERYNYKLIPINEDFSRGIDLEGAVRLYPHRVKGEGQFVAVLKKCSKNELQPCGNLKLKENKLAEKFVLDNTGLEILAYDYRRYAYCVPALSMIKKGINYVSLGVRLGEEKNARLEPNHYLFSAFGAEFKRKIDLPYDSLLAQKYLKGETFSGEISDGYCSILFDSCSIGGGKVCANTIKNHYPKGLRNFK